MSSTAASSLFNPQIVLLKIIFQSAPQCLLGCVRRTCLPEVKNTEAYSKSWPRAHLDAPEKPVKHKTNTLARNPAKLDEACYGRDMKWDGCVAHYQWVYAEITQPSDKPRIDLELETYASSETGATVSRLFFFFKMAQSEKIWAYWNNQQGAAVWVRVWLVTCILCDL